MCKVCDEYEKATGKTLSEEERKEMEATGQELRRAEQAVVPETLEFALAMLKKHGDAAPPALVTAFSLTLGMLIGKAPKEMRPLIFLAAMKDVSNGMNTGKPDDEKIGMVVHDERKNQGQDPWVKPPSVH